MPKSVDRAIRKVASKITPRRRGQSKKSAAIAVLKAKGVIRQKGKHLVKGK